MAFPNSRRRGGAKMFWGLEGYSASRVFHPNQARALLLFEFAETFLNFWNYLQKKKKNKRIPGWLHHSFLDALPGGTTMYLFYAYTMKRIKRAICTWCVNKINERINGRMKNVRANWKEKQYVRIRKTQIILFVYSMLFLRSRARRLHGTPLSFARGLPVDRNLETKPEIATSPPSPAAPPVVKYLNGARTTRPSCVRTRWIF